MDREPSEPLRSAIDRTSAANTGPRAAHIVLDLPERVGVEVDAPSSGLLVLTDSDYPGWHVRIDGQEADILRAYSAPSAVEIPAGEHEIVFEYAPLTYRVGAILSLFSWGALIILGVVTVVGYRKEL